MANDPKTAAAAKAVEAVVGVDPAQKFTLEEAVALIAQSISQQTKFQEALVHNAPKRRKTMEEYIKEKPRKRLLHDVYQNGNLVNPAGLSRETLQKLDTLAPGKYCDGMVDVVRVSDGLGGIASRIHIIYANRSIEQRVMFYIKFPTFTTLVNAIVADMAAQGKPPVHDRVDEARAWQDPVLPPKELVQ